MLFVRARSERATDSRNTMGSYTLVRRLRDSATAEAAAAVLDAVYRANLTAARLSVSPISGVKTHDYFGEPIPNRIDPSPMVPIRYLAASLALDEVEAPSWEAMGDPEWDGMFEVGVIGSVLIAQHDGGSPSSFNTLEEWFDRTFRPALRFPAGYDQPDDAVRIEVTAKGGHPAAIEAIRAYHQYLRADDRYWDSKRRNAASPEIQYPFFAELARDSFIRAEHVERSGQGSESSVLEIEDGRLRMVLYFEDPIDAAQAMRAWLDEQQFHDIEIDIGFEYDDSELGAPPQAAKRVPPPVSRLLDLPDDLSGLDDATVARLAFEIGPYLDPIEKRLQSVSKDELVRQWTEHWRQRSPEWWPDERLVLELVHYAWPATTPWFEDYWDTRARPDSDSCPDGQALCAVLGPDSAGDCVMRWVAAADSPLSRLERLARSRPLPSAGVFEFLESQYHALEGEKPPIMDLARLVARRKIGWERLQRWAAAPAPLDYLAMWVLRERDSVEPSSKPGWREYRKTLGHLSRRYPDYDFRRHRSKNGNYLNPLWRFWARSFVSVL
jgi:hypothetical protein